MLIAMTTSDTQDYVSDLDPCKKTEQVLIDETDASKGSKPKVTISAGATVFKIRSLDVFLKGYIYDNAQTLSGREGSADINILTRVNQTNIDSVRHGLVGFVNFTDSKGDQMKFTTQKVIVNGRSYDVASDAVMNSLGIILVQEMATQIKGLSEVTAGEEKNSEGVSQPSA